MITYRAQRALRISLLLVSMASALTLPFLKGSLVHATPVETVYTGVNTTLAGDDDSAGPFPIGFTFPFYGFNKSSVYVNINGTLNFDGAFSAYSNYPVSGAAPDNAIMAFWDDIITNDDRQSIYYKTVGTAPNRTFIAQWTNMYSYANPEIQLGTFQVLLYENGGKIQLQYRDVLGDSQAKGGSATIGIRADSERYTEYSYESEVLSSHKAILYTPNGSGGYTETDNAPYDYVYLADANSPAIPALTAPSNGATGVSTSPTFSWNAATNADTYHLIVSTDPAFGSFAVNQSGITGTSYSGSSLSASTEYYWRVESVNETGSALSGSYSFTTGAANQSPSTPTSLGPVSMTTHLYRNASQYATPLTFSLADPDLSDQVKYRIQISKAADFSSPVIDYTSALGTQGSRSFAIGQSAGSGTYNTGSASTAITDGAYYWRVKAIDGNGAESAYAAPTGIAFSADGTAPSLAGLTASVSGTTGTASWSAAADSGSGLAATPYTVQLATDSGFTQNLVTASQATTSYSSTLAAGTWYVRVKATDAVGNASAYLTDTLVIAQPVVEPTPTPTPSATPTTSASLAIQSVDTKGPDGNPIVTSLPTFSGTTEPGATVTVTVHSDPVTCTAVADANGAWSCALATALPAGQHTVSISAVTSGGSTLTLADFPVTVVAELAKTGSSTVPVTALGFGLLLFGLFSLRSFRRQGWQPKVNL